MYILYLTINTKNRKIYIGVHYTKNYEVFDGYIGNGINVNQPSTNKFPKTLFQKAVKKHGFDAFQRITLFVCNKKEEAYELEALLVNDQFLKRPDVYNMKLGGEVSPDCSIEVHRYDLNGNYLQSWPSAKKASQELGCSDMSLIYAKLHKTPSFDSYWSEEKMDLLDITEFSKVQVQIIYKYDESGNYLGYYRGQNEAAKELNCSREHVRDCIASSSKCKKYYLSYEKVDKFVKKEKNIHTQKDKIYQYDLEGNFITEFTNCKHAAEELSLNLKSLQSKVSVNKSYKGFQWSYEKVEKLNDIKQKSLSSTVKQVDQFTLDGEYVKTWESYSECRKLFPNVGKVLRGVTNKCKGFNFKYKD